MHAGPLPGDMSAPPRGVTPKPRGLTMHGFSYAGKGMPIPKRWDLYTTKGFQCQVFFGRSCTRHEDYTKNASY